MPKYVYRCKECEGHFTTVHGMTERQDHCEICFASSCLIRVPQMPHIKTSDADDNWRQSNRPVGTVVREAIEENARILKEEKERSSKWEFDNDS